MPTILAPVLKQRFFDVNGAPLSGGLLYSYIAGTTTPLVTYSNKAATAANTNPIILDSAGECDLWMLPGSYKFILSNSADVAQWTRDGVEIVDPENADDSFTDISYITDADSPVTVSTGASGTMYSVNASAGNVIINLPSIAALSLTNGYSVGVKKTDSSTNTVTINPDGTDTIQGASTLILALQNEAIKFVADADADPDEWTTLVVGIAKGTFQLEDGSAASPSLTFEDEPDMGFYRSAAGQVALAMSGVKQAGFTETTSGYSNFGIGNYSTSDSLPFYLLRTQNLGTGMVVANNTTGTGAVSYLGLECGTGGSHKSQISQYSTGTTLTSLAGRLALRSRTGTGVSVCAEASGADIRHYLEGFFAADEYQRFGKTNVTFDCSGTIVPDASLAFEITGTTTKGSKPAPSMTATQRDAISSPKNGSIIYNTDSNLYNYYNDTAWNDLVGGASVPAGVITAYGGTSAPTGYLLCDGASVSRTTYADLFTAISTAYGTASGSTFNLPDLRGKFARGTDSTAGNDPDAAGRTVSATGGNTGDNVGSIQGDAFQGHIHEVPSYKSSSAGASGGSFTAITTGGSTNHVGGPLSDGSNGTPRTTSETRPLNVNVNYIIKT